MGLLNTVWAVILPMWFAPFYIFLIRQFMVGLPNELLEAGQVDGAGTFRCYWHIVLPVCRPIIGAAVALSFADCWNLVEQPMTYLSQRMDLQPLSVMFNQLAASSRHRVRRRGHLHAAGAVHLSVLFEGHTRGRAADGAEITRAEGSSLTKVFAMNLKKFAIRGIVILAVFVALCMFFSGTVRTITTPKVRLTAAKRGKLEERVELACKVAFPEVDEVELPLPEDTTLTIDPREHPRGLHRAGGRRAGRGQAGELRPAAQERPEAYDRRLRAADDPGEQEPGHPRQQARSGLCRRLLRPARRPPRRRGAGADMEAQLGRRAWSAWTTGYPEGASDALKELIDAWREAAEAQRKAQEAMDAAGRYTVPDDVWSYITEQREQQEKKDEAEAQLRQLVTLNDQVKAIAAPHDGYIATVDVKEGDVYDGSRPLLTLTQADKLPTLRADIAALTRNVSEGMTVALNPDSYDAIETQVVAVGTDSEGKKYADIELTEALIKARGSVYSMLQEDTPMTLIYRAREATSLLPTSAVRGSGDERYVFVTEQNTAAFGGNTLRLHRMDVTVAGRIRRHHLRQGGHQLLHDRLRRGPRHQRRRRRDGIPELIGRRA